MIRGIFALLVIVFTIHSAGAQSSSVLSSGQWYKLAVTETGLYKLDYSFFTENGIDPASIDPLKLSIYGNGGGILPQPNSTPRQEDLQELSISVVGETDGNFDQEDYLLFFAEGPDKWIYNGEKQVFIEEENYYSDTNFYYLRLDHPTTGKRVSAGAELAAGSDTISSFTERISFEQDITSVLKSGREWYGDLFSSTPTRTYSLNLKNLEQESTIKLHTTLMGRSRIATFFTVAVNNTLLDTVPFDMHGFRYWQPIADSERNLFPIGPEIHTNNSILNITLKYDGKEDIYSQGYLDAFDINYQRNLDLSNDLFLMVQHGAAGGTKTLEISGAIENVITWDITDRFSVKTLSGNQVSMKNYVSVSTDPEKQYLIFRGSNFPAPVVKGKVENQNLRGLSTPDFLIISHPKFISVAEDLAAFRRSHDGLQVEVVTTEQIYNEFSSGKPDVTALRDFVRHLYLNSSESDSLKYLLLFGDCSYDYKDRISNNTNLVPTYQCRESLNPLATYASDDYFGFLETNEGIWAETADGNHTMEIGVGRIPCRTVEEGENYVNKVKKYQTQETELGSWRSKITLISDDGDFNLHVKDNEKHASYLDQYHKKFNLQKIYTDMYPHVLDANDIPRSPEGRKRVTDAVEEGTLIFNYVGHGGWNGVSSEDLMNTGVITAWANKDHYPFFVAATCAFGLLDDPARYSLGKIVVTKKESGGIGIISGSRAAFSTANFSFNSAFFRSVFKDGLRMGDIMRETKNNSVMNVYNRHVVMYGDPTLKLEYPSEIVSMTSLNESTDYAGDTLNALKEYTINGIVADNAGVQIADFNGTADILIYEHKIVRTLGYDGDKSPQMNIPTRESILHKGYAPITAGAFSYTFALPVEGADSIGSVRVYMYAHPSTGLRDGHGIESSLSAGGINEEAPIDVEGPLVHAYMDSLTFQNGDTVRARPVLQASLSDQGGLNISDRKYLLSVINSDSTIILNKYFTPDTGSYKSGTVLFPFDSLPDGDYTLMMSAWDNYNNLTETSIDFVVRQDFLSPIFKPLGNAFEFTAYPNPFRDHANIKIKLPPGVAGQANADIVLYTMAGTPILSISETVSNAKTLVISPEEQGITLPPGMYLLQATIYSPVAGKTFQAATVIIRQ